MEKTLTASIHLLDSTTHNSRTAMSRQEMWR